MEKRVRARGLLLACLFGTVGLPLGPAQAGVPEACRHRQADRRECVRETRLQHLKVLPSARIRALRDSRRDIVERPSAIDPAAVQRLEQILEYLERRDARDER